MTSVSGGSDGAQHPGSRVLTTRRPEDVPCLAGCTAEHGADVAEGVKYCKAPLGSVFPQGRHAAPLTIAAVRLVDLLDTSGASDEPEHITIDGQPLSLVEARSLARRILDRIESQPNG